MENDVFFELPNGSCSQQIHKERWQQRATRATFMETFKRSTSLVNLFSGCNRRTETRCGDVSAASSHTDGGRGERRWQRKRSTQAPDAAQSQPENKRRHETRLNTQQRNEFIYSRWHSSTRTSSRTRSEPTGHSHSFPINDTFNESDNVDSVSQEKTHEHLRQVINLFTLTFPLKLKCNIDDIRAEQLSVFSGNTDPLPGWKESWQSVIKP